MIANAFSVKYDLKGGRLGVSIYLVDPYKERAKLYKAGRELPGEPAASERPATGKNKEKRFSGACVYCSRPNHRKKDCW